MDWATYITATFFRGGGAPLTGLDDTFRSYVQSFLDYLRYLGASPAVTSGKRTREQQQRLYDLWRSGSPQQRYPVARPGTSAHEHGLAVDITFPNTAQLQQAIELAPRFNLKWGGSKDPVHFAASWWTGGTEDQPITDPTCVFGICTDPACDPWGRWFLARARQVATQYGIGNREAEQLLREWIEYYYPEVFETCERYFVVQAESPF